MTVVIDTAPAHSAPDLLEWTDASDEQTSTWPWVLLTVALYVITLGALVATLAIQPGYFPHTAFWCGVVVVGFKVAIPFPPKPVTTSTTVLLAILAWLAGTFLGVIQAF